MKKLFKNHIYLLLLFSLFIFSCEEEGEPAENPPDSNIVYILEDITEVTTWFADSIYVIKAWDFYVENTLTIQAGTIIKFHTDGPDLTLGSGGTILATGTATKPIIFTSFKDDDRGGDTNGDGSTSLPSALDWGGISTNDENGYITA